MQNNKEEKSGLLNWIKIIAVTLFIVSLGILGIYGKLYWW